VKGGQGSLKPLKLCGELLLVVCVLMGAVEHRVGWGIMLCSYLQCPRISTDHKAGNVTCIRIRAYSLSGHPAAAYVSEAITVGTGPIYM
jgi:hypothetical protein